MSLDSRQKRAAVIGVARPWYRNADSNSLDAAQRASIANTYPIAAFSPKTSGFSGNLIILRGKG